MCGGWGAGDGCGGGGGGDDGGDGVCVCVCVGGGGQHLIMCMTNALYKRIFTSIDDLSARNVPLRREGCTCVSVGKLAYLNTHPDQKWNICVG